ncbi:galanin receptor 1 [Mytilus galloprovincialis]|uniref:Galanin receptor 1 n=1 Tax=Mytilus galloprovincialis TaxID=29158 RepID=A0A8B6CBU4_MYTGA|nr:galanin receptor 1 [Mytilus galloprovincialis]
MVLVMNTTTVLNRTNLTVIYDYYGPALTSFFAVWLIIIILCSIIGNILVMLVILLDSKMRHVHNHINLFLFNLALSDVMTGLFDAPVSLYTLTQEHWDLGDFLCNANLFLNATFLFTSVHSLMYISIHKYISIRRLSDCNTTPVGKCACYTMILASWGWGIVFALLTTFYLSAAEYKAKTIQCGPKYPIFNIKSFALSFGNLMLNFVIPLIIMVIMYSRIYFVIKDDAVFRRKSTTQQKDIRSRSDTKVVNEKAVIHTLVIVLSCFIICWLPYMFYTNFIFFTIDRKTIPAFLNPLAYCFGFSSSACNPVIYAFRFPDLKNGYLQILKKLSCRILKSKLYINDALDR